MAQLRYIGQVEKTLIDVAALAHGVIIDVADEFAQRLLTAFPDQYELATSAPAQKTAKKEPVVETVTAETPAAPIEAPATTSTTPAVVETPAEPTSN